MNIETMRAKLDEVRQELEGLLEQPELSDEQEARYDELEAEAVELKDSIRKAEERAVKLDEIRAAAQTPSNVETGAFVRDEAEDVATRDSKIWDLTTLERGYNSPEDAATDLRSRALSAVEKAPGLNDAMRQAATARLESLDIDDSASGVAKVARHVVAVSNPAYQRAFNQMLKQFARSGAVVVPDVVQRAMSLTDASGGYAVPLPVDPTLILNDDGSVNPFRRISTVRTAVTDVVRTVNSTAVTASWDAEGAEVSDDATTFANIDITVHKAAAFVPFSIEISQDYPGFQEDIRMLLADARDNLEATAFATGSGSSQPYGIVTALQGGSYEITSNTTDTFALGDVYDVDEELPARFADRASWVANKKIYQAIREAGGANLDDFWVNLRDGRPPVLLGHPAYESSAMDGVIDATAENRVLVLGDFSNYRIYDRVGLSIELVPHLFHTTTNRPSGQRGLYAYWRVGADSVNDRAFRLLNVT